MKIQLNIGRRKAIGIMRTAQSMEQALKIIRHNHSNYDKAYPVIGWDTARKQFAIEVTRLAEGTPRQAAQIYNMMRAQ